MWKTGKRGLALLAAAVLSLTLVSGCAQSGTPAADGEAAALPVRAEQLTGTGLRPVAQKGSMTLSVNPSDGQFTVENSETGLVLHSTPTDLEADTLASGYNQLTIGAAFEITYISSRKITDTTNSTVASVRKGGLTVHATEDGAIFTYDMPDLGLTVPLAVVLQEDSFEVSVLLSEVKEYGDYKLLEIVLMPYLGCAGVQDDGYLLVPDGSGALVNFTAGTEAPAAFTYKKAIYGEDPMDPLANVVSKSETIQLPAFGIKTQERALLGVVTQGEALGSIQLYAKGTRSLHAAAHTVVRYRGTSSRSLFDNEWNRKRVIIVGEDPVSQPQYTVRYYLMKDADYSDMAAQTAECLRSLGGQTLTRKSEARIPISVLGAVRRQSSFLGIPVKTVYALNDYEAVADIAAELKEKGFTSWDLFYEGMFAGGLYDKMPVKAKTEGALGSTGELASLAETLRADGITLYPQADLSRIYASGHGVSSQWDASRDFAGGIRTITSFSRVTYYEDSVNPLTHTLLKASEFGRVYQSFTDGLSRLGLTAFADSGAGTVASHNPHGSEKTDRQQAVQLQEQAIAAATEGLSGYAAENAPAYLLPYVSASTQVPASSSRLDGFSEEIPFYSLVAGQFANLSTGWLNEVDDLDGYMLRCLEYGLLPSAYISAQDTAAVADTFGNGMYAADRQAVEEKLLSIWDTYGQALTLIGEQPMTAHEKVAEHVYCSTFADGRTLYVNYADTPAVVGELLIPAGGYWIAGGNT